jgi:4-aminobutyrate aminotransferase-like enzyme
MIGLEMADPRLGMAVFAAMVHNGVAAFFANYRTSTVLIRPPLIIQADEVDFVLEALDQSLAFVTAHPEMADLIPEVGVF